MILLLLSASKSWSTNNNDTIPLRGDFHTDSTYAIIPINFIKKANIKLIERKYFIKEINVKDSIISLQNELILQQTKDINIYKLHIDESYKINADINEQLIKYKKRINLYNNIGIGGATAILLYLILK